MADAQLPILLTFEDARRLVAMQVKEPGMAGVSRTGYEDAQFFLVQIDYRPGYEFDAPVILVEKATGHVLRQPWTRILDDDIRAMRQVSA